MDTKDILAKTLNESISFINDIDKIPPNIGFDKSGKQILPESKWSFDDTLAYFNSPLSLRYFRYSRTSLFRVCNWWFNTYIYSG